MSDFTPDDIRLAFAESFTLHTMEEPHLSRAYEVFDRFIAKVKADTWDEARSPGAWDKTNPYRVEEEAPQPKPDTDG